jgi:hypothetical protein
MLRAVDTPASLCKLVLQTRAQVKIAREALSELKSATQRTLDRVEQTEQRIRESDGLIDDFRSSLL